MSIGEMSDHEMLVELMKDKKKRDTWRIVRIAAAVVIVAVIAVMALKYVPRIIALAEEAQNLMGRINSMVDQVGGVMDNLGEDSLNQLKSSIEKLNSLLSLFNF